MTSREQYLQDGYTIVRRCVPLDAVGELRSLVTAMNLNKRKPDLIGNPHLKQAVDDVLRPLFIDIGVQAETIQELSALIASNSRAVKLGWHRDRPPGNGRHAFQLPLLPGDHFHELVPGSHIRDLTDSEIAVRNAGGTHMPGAVAIELAIGDILLRSPLIFHRGYNPDGTERVTLVGTYT